MRNKEGKVRRSGEPVNTQPVCERSTVKSGDQVYSDRGDVASSRSVVCPTLYLLSDSLALYQDYTASIIMVWVSECSSPGDHH
jgi:hypothetical protein